MIVLDTNVLSELVRPRPEPSVVDWVNRQRAGELVITALTAAEVRAGVALLERGRRQRDIDTRVEELLTAVFADRVLAFGLDSTAEYARIVATRRRAGRPIGVVDAQIAAICARHHSSLATRNVDAFEGVGVRLVNPWN